MYVPGHRPPQMEPRSYANTRKVATCLLTDASSVEGLVLRPVWILTCASETGRFVDTQVAGRNGVVDGASTVGWGLCCWASSYRAWISLSSLAASSNDAA